MEWGGTRTHLALALQRILICTQVRVHLRQPAHTRCEHDVQLDTSYHAHKDTRSDPRTNGTCRVCNGKNTHCPSNNVRTYARQRRETHTCRPHWRRAVSYSKDLTRTRTHTHTYTRHTAQGVTHQSRHSGMHKGQFLIIPLARTS